MTVACGVVAKRQKKCLTRNREIGWLDEFTKCKWGWHDFVCKLGVDGVLSLVRYGVYECLH